MTEKPHHFCPSDSFNALCSCSKIVSLVSRLLLSCWSALTSVWSPVSCEQIASSFMLALRHAVLMSSILDSSVSASFFRAVLKLYTVIKKPTTAMISAMDIVASVPTCLYLTLPVLKIVLISSHEDSVQPDDPLTHTDFACVHTPFTLT